MIKILINYNTGDSFHNEDNIESHLEMTWENLDVAKENLQRIKEHYKWYQDKENSHFSWKNKGEKLAPEPEWHKGMEYDFSIKLKADNGNEMQMTAFWCGYFESLNSAEIINDNSDMKITFE
jgi:hypothetical protein